MKKTLYYTKIFIISSLIWIILNEHFSVPNIIIGGALGLLSFKISDQFLLQTDYRSTYSLSLIVILKYLLYLIFEIYYSGISAIGKILSGKINPGVVEISTELTNDLYISILANSITMTPGTVTLDKKGQKLVVLWLDCVTKDPKKAGKLIKGNFEKILLMGESK